MDQILIQPDLYFVRCPEDIRKILQLIVGCNFCKSIQSIEITDLTTDDIDVMRKKVNNYLTELDGSLPSLLNNIIPYSVKRLLPCLENVICICPGLNPESEQSRIYIPQSLDSIRWLRGHFYYKLNRIDEKIIITSRHIGEWLEISTPICCDYLKLLNDSLQQTELKLFRFCSSGQGTLSLDIYTHYTDSEYCDPRFIIGKYLKTIYSQDSDFRRKIKVVKDILTWLISVSIPDNDKITIYIILAVVFKCLFKDDDCNVCDYLDLISQ